MEHRWTRRRTVIAGQTHPDDWCVLCDGHVVGRVHRAPAGSQAGRWSWAVQTLPGAGGYAGTLEAALESVREGVRFGPDGLLLTAAVAARRII